MALDLVFDANAVTELGDAAARSRDEVLASASELERQVDALGPALGEDDQVVRFARLVLAGLDLELGQLENVRRRER